MAAHRIAQVTFLILIKILILVILVPSVCKLKTLSAESSFDSRSEGSGSSEEEVASPISFSSMN